MTRDEAEALVENLLQACIDYERADSHRVGKARQEYHEKKDAVIAALTAGERK